MNNKLFCICCLKFVLKMWSQNTCAAGMFSGYGAFPAYPQPPYGGYPYPAQQQPPQNRPW